MNSAAAVLELPVADSPESEPRCVDAPRVWPHSNATVTAVIPTFGRPELVCTAIQSALAQTHRNLEVIVVIDGPDRRTLQEIESLRQPRVRVIELAAKVGGAEARNIGVRARLERMDCLPRRR
jgi:glycosyltransferase involved in cell wall biosynthesis